MILARVIAPAYHFPLGTEEGYAFVGTVSPQLMFVCRWYALLLARSVNTQLALCGAWSGALDVTGHRLIATGRLWFKSADGVAAWKTAGSVAVHCGSLDGACGSVKPDEARELIRLVPTKVFAHLLLSLVTLRLTERAARARELHCWKCTC
jgi:hypothetical protein